MQDVCDLMLHVKLRAKSASTQQNLADYVVHLALQKATTDNVAAVVVPLGSPRSSVTTLEDSSHLDENPKTSIMPFQTIPYQLEPGSLTDQLLF
uniref:protein-serine/threonine phosphatase n=1 Tax=Arundo donax TaxID=35708 RepID=A0A0A9G9P9_ARUDO